MLQRAIEFGRQNGADDSLVQDAQGVSLGQVLLTPSVTIISCLLQALSHSRHGRGWKR